MPVSSFTNRRFFSCNAHVLVPEDPAASPGSVVAVDPGYYGPDVRDAVEAGGGLGAVLLTHGHWDHIGCTDELLADWPGVPVYIHEGDAAFLHDTRLNGSAAHGFSSVVEAAATTFSEGGLEVCGHRIEVLHTPGHTAGSSVFHLPDDGLVFTGDTIMDGGVGRTDLPTGNQAQLVESLRRLVAAGIDSQAVAYVGHGRNMGWLQLLRSVGLV